MGLSPSARQNGTVPFSEAVFGPAPRGQPKTARTAPVLRPPRSHLGPSPAPPLLTDRSRRGLTLVELMVTITIIAILATLFLARWSTPRTTPS